MQSDTHSRHKLDHLDQQCKGMFMTLEGHVCFPGEGIPSNFCSELDILQKNPHAYSVMLVQNITNLSRPRLTTGKKHYLLLHETHWFSAKRFGLVILEVDISVRFHILNVWLCTTSSGWVADVCAALVNQQLCKAAHSQKWHHIHYSG